MLALTIWQPWAWLIANGHKLVENREWPPPPGVLGQTIAIHAGLKRIPIGDWYSIQGALEIDRGIILPPRESVPFGAIVATARLAAIIRNAGELSDDQRYWFNGPVGWVLENVRAIEPIPVKGAQGLWRVDDSALRKVGGRR